MVRKSCQGCFWYQNSSCYDRQMQESEYVGDCWKYRDAKEKLNISNRSGESPSHRIPGTWGS